MQHLFALEQREDLVKSIMETAAAFIGIAIKQRKDPITLDQFQTHRLGKHRYVIAAAFIGIAIKQRKDPITLDQFQTHRLGKHRYVVSEDFNVLDSIFFPI